MIDLSKLLPANSGWELINAFAINNRGQIVGIGMHNGKSRAFLLTLGPADTQGPVTSNVSVLPSPANAAPTVTAKVDDTSTGGSVIVAAEYFIDKQGTSGKGTPLGAAFDTATQTVTAVLPAGTFNSLKQGKHTVYVHGKDIAGNWGKLVSAIFFKDALGPVASSVKVAPSPTNAKPTLTVKIDDTSKGGSILAAAEYFIDAPGGNGSGTPIDVVSGKVAQTVTAVLESQAFADLSEGSHKVYVHGKDAAGNWGDLQSTNFVKTASTTAVASPPAGAAKSSTRSVSAARANDAAILAWLMDSPTKLREREPQSSDILLEGFSARILDQCTMP